jgi:hypothetical protein
VEQRQGAAQDDHPPTGFADIAHAACGDHAKLQQEEAQHPLERSDEEWCDAFVYGDNYNAALTTIKITH